MEFNKNHIIYVLSALSVSLILYIIFEKSDVKTVTKIEYQDKIIYQDRVVYKDRIIENNSSKSVELESFNASQAEPIQAKQEENIISTITDISHRYKIFLVSDEEIPKLGKFTKVVFRGNLIDDEGKNIFVMDVNQAILENLNSVYFKVIDTQTNEEYINYNTCIYGTVANYVYKVNLELTGGEVFCTMAQERELPKEAQGLMPQSRKVVDFKENVLRVDKPILNEE